MDLQEFQFKITHRPGKLNANVDALSRLKVKDPKMSQQNQNQLNSCANPKPNMIHTQPESCAVTINPRVSLKQVQRLDLALALLIEFKKSGRDKPNFSAWAKDPRLKHFWYQYDRLFLKEDLLVRSIRRNSPIPQYAIVIPDALISQVLQEVHDSAFIGHLGITRTENQIRKRFYWPGVRKSVENYIKVCPTCARTKVHPNVNKVPLQSIEIGEPFSFWTIDYMGSLPEMPRGNCHLLVIMDYFTNWCEAIPIKDQKASMVAPLLVNKIFSRFGPPTILHSDQGANLESNLMHEICDVMGVTKTRTTAYHPSGDGQVERQNRTLQAMLAAFGHAGHACRHGKMISF